MNKKIGIIVAIVLLVAGVLVGKSFIEKKEVDQTDIEKYINGLSTREVVEKMENDLDEDISGAVWQDRIELEYKNESVELVDSDDLFYVSIAPYVNSTHEWAIHSLAGCRGEFGNRNFEIKLQDNEGNIVYEGNKESYSNGFIGFWLDRDKVYTIDIYINDKSGTFEFETFSDSYTCITSFQLK